MSEKLSSRQLEVLRELAKPGNYAHYMRYMGSFNPTAYYFLHASDGKTRCTAQIRALRSRGLAEVVKRNACGDHQVVISAAGRQYLQQVPQ